MPPLLKENWNESRERFCNWWNNEGLLVGSWAQGIPDPQKQNPVEKPVPENLEQQWFDPQWRVRCNELLLTNGDFPLDILPMCDVDLGPGSLALMAGSAPELQKDSLWFEPADFDPFETPIQFDPENKHLSLHRDLIRHSQKVSNGRWFTGIQDLVENLDVLASLRDSQELLFDLLDRPDEVVAKTFEINRLYFQVYDTLYHEFYADGDGTPFTAFRLWAPGKGAKVQCDIAAMISPDSFNACVVPALTEQCEWLDQSMFHLDGSQAMVHLDSLLSIDSLDAIEWTPEPGQPNGGDPHWYDLYRKIKTAGKSVQAIDVQPNQIIPLIDAVGPEGLYILANFQTLEEAQGIEKLLAAYNYG